MLHRDRFDKFLDAVAPRLPVKGRVVWLAAPRQSRNDGEASRSVLVDMTPEDGPVTGGAGETEGTRGRRMFVQVGCTRNVPCTDR